FTLNPQARDVEKDFLPDVVSNLGAERLQNCRALRTSDFGSVDAPLGRRRRGMAGEHADDDNHAAESLGHPILSGGDESIVGTSLSAARDRICGALRGGPGGRCPRAREISKSNHGGVATVSTRCADV